MENNKNKELINIIEQTIIDTRYIKDKETPYSNICKTFFFWTLFYSLVSFIIYLYHIIGDNFLLFEKDWYYSISRVLNISLFSILLISYFVIFSKKSMSLKEKDFLKFYSIIPVFLVFTRIIYPLTYYLNTDILIGLYNTLSLDLLILIFSAFMINFYFKSKFSRNLILLNIIIYIANMIFFSIYITIDAPSTLLIDVNMLITMCRDNGAFVILHFIIVILFLKKVSKVND